MRKLCFNQRGPHVSLSPPVPHLLLQNFHLLCTSLQYVNGRSSTTTSNEHTLLLFWSLTWPLLGPPPPPPPSLDPPRNAPPQKEVLSTGPSRVYGIVLWLLSPKPTEFISQSHSFFNDHLSVTGTSRRRRCMSWPVNGRVSWMEWKIYEVVVAIYIYLANENATNSPFPETRSNRRRSFVVLIVAAYSCLFSGFSVYLVHGEVRTRCSTC